MCVEREQQDEPAKQHHATNPKNGRAAKQKEREE